MHTIADHAQALAGGTTTSRALVEDCLARIADPAGEGARAFTVVHAAAARAMADAADALRRAGRAPGPYAGIPIGVKDLFDIAGETTPRRLARAGRRAARHQHTPRSSPACSPPASCRSVAPT